MLKQKNNLSFQYEAYNQYALNDAIVIEKKEDDLKIRVLEFSKIHSLEDAKKLSKKIIPVANEVNKFSVGNATCVVINKYNLFSITYDDKDNYICYRFA